MTNKKYSPAYFIFIGIILSVFAAPFVYRTATFYNHLSEYDYQKFPADPKVGEQVKTILEFSNNETVKVYRDRRWYYGMWNRRQIADRIVTYSAPVTMEIHDESGKSMLLKTSDEEIFMNILDAGRSSEQTDSLVLYIFVEKGQYYECFEVVEGLAGASKTGEKLDASILQQFSLDEQHTEITDLNTFLHTMDYTERLEEKAPALLYNRQNSIEGQLIFGEFEVTNTTPLTVKCISYTSHEHSDKLKAKLWSNWFSGLDLLLWIVFVIFFGISMFFITKIISRIVKGRPID